jgi:hypothetical protein
VKAFCPEEHLLPNVSEQESFSAPYRFVGAETLMSELNKEFQLKFIKAIFLLHKFLS